MKSRFIELTCVHAALLAASVAGAQGSVATDWKLIAKPPLPAFQSATPLRVALPNGMVIFLQEDRALPLIRGSALIRGGAREEPADKLGLASILGQAWRTSGTATRSGDALDDYLEGRGARVETGASNDAVSVSFDSLKDSFPDVFAVFVDLLKNPAFKDDKIALAKNQINTGIARRNDDVASIAAREARFLGYGKDSPLARVPEYFTVAAVTKDDVSAWHKSHVVPNNIILSVIGDFDAKAMEATLRNAFGAWPKGVATVSYKAPVYDPRPGVYFIQRDDVNQSQIRMVHAGILRSNPDYYAVTVMNEILGGGFSARLFTNVRSKKGLAYAVGGGVGAGRDQRGLFQLQTSTKSQTTAAAIDALFEEMDGMKKNPPSEDELKRAKDAIANSFIFQLDTPRKALQERVQNEFYGMPLNLLDQYLPGIQKVTAADVARAVSQYLQRDKLAILVVGKSQDFDRPLSSLGAVTPIDITIPEAKPSSAAPGSNAIPAPGTAAASSPEAKALFAKVMEALGGVARLKAVTGVREKATLKAKTPMGEQSVETTSLVVFPDKARQELQTPMGSMVTVISPDAAFAQMGPMGNRDLPASQKESQLKSLRMNPVTLASRMDDPKLMLSLASAPEKVDAIDARVLTISYEGADVKWFVDPSTGRIVRTARRVGPAEETTDLSDYRMVQGVAIAFKRRISAATQEAEITVTEYVVNPTIDPALFIKK